MTQHQQHDSGAIEPLSRCNRCGSWLYRRQACVTCQLIRKADSPRLPQTLTSRPKSSYDDEQRHSVHSLMHGLLTNSLNRRPRALPGYGSYTVGTRESRTVSLTRVSQRRNTKRPRYMAISGAIPHDQHRIHDGQEWQTKPFPAHKPIRSGA